VIPERIEREIVIEASPERVWAVLTEPEHVGVWFAESVEGDLRPGGASVLSWEEHGSFNIQVEKAEPPRYFAFRWAARSPGADPAEGNSTLVEFRLIPEADGTRLHVVESGFRDLYDEQADYVRDNTQGWIGALDSLRDYVAKTAEAPAPR
jgi:uncharacterized protein YndB with AHSA1/START domain